MLSYDRLDSGPDAAMKRNIEVVKLAMDYIDENIGEKLTFVSVAGKFNYSPFFFDRVFQRIAGMTITEYIRESRLLAAADKLAGTEATVTELCLACGFESSQAFSRAFKQRFAATPVAYRKSGTRPEPRRSSDLIQACLGRFREEQREMTPKIIETKNDMILACVSGDGSRTGEAWERFEALEKDCPAPDRVSQDAYELRIYPKGRCDIFVGIEVEHADTSGKYETYVLPKGLYASFEILLANGWEHSNRLMDEWLGNNGRFRQRREEASGAYYAVEVYGDRFLGMDNLDSVIDMWVPLELITV
jgi:AraC-like DNA-binding protein